jgi:hypothetical protein
MTAPKLTPDEVIDGIEGGRLALEVAALTRINERQVALVLAAEAKAEEQRHACDMAWERVHKLEDELRPLRAERDRLRLAIEHVVKQYPRFVKETDGGEILRRAMVGEGWATTDLVDEMKAEVERYRVALVSINEQTKAHPPVSLGGSINSIARRALDASGKETK